MRDNMFRHRSTRRMKLLVIGFCLLTGAFSFFGKITSGEKMSVEEYNNWISATYDFRFGKDRPFSPSNATSFNGKFIAGEKFVSSARCAKCHTDIHPQWRDSVHANAFREPFYQKNVKDLQEQKNIAYTRH